jgi:glycosyltransferase involved in cell wall biosynthesis
MDGVRRLGLRRDLPAQLDVADAIVLSLAWKAEAMAIEKPVVVTEVSGVRQLDGDVEILVPGQNSDALADAKVALMRTPPEAREYQGRFARVRIEELSSMNSKTAEWETLYHSSVGHPHGR